LQCVSMMTPRDLLGRRMTPREDVRHTMKHSVEAIADGSGMRIPVAFDIRHDAKPTGKDGDDDFFWRLDARAGQRGADYDATFIVPVFRVPDGEQATPVQ